MVEIPFGKGYIFFTSFHDNAQASETEQALMKLLFLKLASRSQNVSLQQAGQDLNVSIDQIQQQFQPELQQKRAAFKTKIEFKGTKQHGGGSAAPIFKPMTKNKNQQ